jgi:uncharacterized phage protein (TIGR02220 family)
MTEIRKFKGVFISADLWLDRTLSITEKAFLVEIESLQSDDRGCYRSNAAFGDFFDLSPSRVSEIISSLVQKGHVEVRQIRDGNRVVERQIWMKSVFGKPNRGYSENPSNPFGKGDEGYSEKAKGSNTKEEYIEGLIIPDVSKDVLQYLNQKTGKGFMPVAANLDLIKARLKEGVTAEQIKAVIDAKVLEWAGSQKMEQYLRPKTLFAASNFANYVGVLGSAKPNKDRRSAVAAAVQAEFADITRGAI